MRKRERPKPGAVAAAMARAQLAEAMDKVRQAGNLLSKGIALRSTPDNLVEIDRGPCEERDCNVRGRRFQFIGFEPTGDPDIRDKLPGPRLGWITRTRRMCALHTIVVLDTARAALAADNERQAMDAALDAARRF